MRKLIVFASALALSGSMAFAMEEKAMDEMMEAPAPSVALSGAAEIGFKNVDDDSKPDAESIVLIRKYQVNFSSQGTTDGGLMFGAGISIEDEQGIDEDANEVGGSNVYIGSADGTWKLKFGGNDPGIDVAGGIGVADDHFDGGNDTTIGLEGAFGGTSYRITMADPQEKGAADGDWSAGASYSLGEFKVGFGMDSESGLALALGSEFSGIGVDLYWSKSEESMTSMESRTDKFIAKNFTANKLAAAGNTLGVDGSELTGEDLTAYNEGRYWLATSSYGEGDDDTHGSIETTGLGLKFSMSAGEGATFSAAYSMSKEEHAGAVGSYDTTGDGSAVIETTAREEMEIKEIEIGFNYDLGGGATLKTSIVKTDTETSGSITSNDYVEATAGTHLPNPEGGDTGVESINYNSASDKTTLKAVLAFTF